MVPVLVLGASALVLSGCGGSDDSSSSSSDSGSSSDSTAQSDDSGAAADGKSLFTSSCGGCHTLSDAGTTGAAGPNLDDAKPSADHVRTMIDEGGGAMPAGLLEGEQADAVAEYVAGAAGK